MLLLSGAEALALACGIYLMVDSAQGLLHFGFDEGAVRCGERAHVALSFAREK
jgi:hypothetical protein